MSILAWILGGILVIIGGTVAGCIMLSGPQRTEAEQAMDDAEQITEITEWTERQRAKREEK